MTPLTWLIFGVSSGLGQFTFVLNCRLFRVRLQTERKLIFELLCTFKSVVRVLCPEGYFSEVA